MASLNYQGIGPRLVAQIIDGIVLMILCFVLGLAAFGAVLYFWWAPQVLMPPLAPFVGSGGEERRRRTRTLTLLPYLVGGVTFLAAGLLNPHGLVLVLISAAAASFGGTSLLAWYPGLWARRARTSPGGPTLGVPRSVPWLALGLVVLVVFVGVLGPGIALGPGR